jgi:CRP-like cAMP-binding protein
MVAKDEDASGFEGTMHTHEKPQVLHNRAARLLRGQDAASSSPCRACPVRLRSVCSGLDVDELEALERIVTRVTVKAGGPIFDEGETAHYRYNVTAGSIKIYKLLGDGRRQIIGFLFPGDFLGLALEDEYAYGAETVMDSELCRFPRRDLDDLINRFPALENLLLSATSNEWSSWDAKAPKKRSPPCCCCSPAGRPTAECRKTRFACP